MVAPFGGGGVGGDEEDEVGEELGVGAAAFAGAVVVVWPGVAAGAAGVLLN